MLVGELEGLDEADGLLDRAADGQVVDGNLAEGALRVDDEEAAKGDALVLEKDAVVAGDLVRLVGEERELEVRAEAALFAGQVGPGNCLAVDLSAETRRAMMKQAAGGSRTVRELGVGRDAKDLGVELGKLGEGGVESKDLGRADERELKERDQAQNKSGGSGAKEEGYEQPHVHRVEEHDEPEGSGSYVSM
jgi:hypothetical protein